MKINFNNAEYNLQLEKTEFANYWHEWVFAESNTVSLINPNLSKLDGDFNNWVEHTQRLTALIELNNRIVKAEGLPARYLFEERDWKQVDSDFLVQTHEHWAQITKEACEEHLPVFNADTCSIYNTINSLMQEQNEAYPNINSYVHRVEFAYKFFFMHNVSIQRPMIPRGEYQIKPGDTSFVRHIVCLPYFDIGRPQFEKYTVSGAVSHDEISNYLSLANRIEFTANVMQEYVPQEFINECAVKGVPIYGNYVNVASSADRNPAMLGQFFLQHYNQNGNNTIALVK